MQNRGDLLKKVNAAEERIEDMMKRAAIIHSREFAIHHGRRDYFIDFAIETLDGMVALEVDGKHHFTPKGQAADRLREKALFASSEFVAVVRLSWPVAMSIDATELWLTLTNSAKVRGSVRLIY